LKPAPGSATQAMFDVGVGLWTMRSTAARPAGVPDLYARLRADARLAEQLGFHSLWVAEHHFWYDGWCPATVTAAATVLGATTRLRAGTGIQLLSLWEPECIASAVSTLAALSGGRLELGVGLGYRDEEYDGFGFSRRVRAHRMDSALDRLSTGWGDAGAPPIMVGGFSDVALQRAGSRGLGVFLPFSMSRKKLRDTIERYREIASAAGMTPGRIGMLKYAWATDGSSRAREDAKAVIAASAREYSGAWFPLRGSIGFDAPDLLDGQLRLAADNALIGPADEIAEQLDEIRDAGVDIVVLQITRDDVEADHRTNMEAIAAGVLPAVARA
jgi:alkanesulfonate monooxygenase SsuD/methylene tetrahydromethanopterin reductase-like flavin-dependent oxidoreductase (luciferase family)